jgi:hypothetical protein
MNNYRAGRLFTYGILIILILSLIGCYSKGKAYIKAVYLIPDAGGQLTKESISKYSEVVYVTSSNELKKLVSSNTAIWIDKDAVNLVDLDWLQKQAENKIPIVLVGYNNAIYSFREILSLYGIKGPHINWDQKKLEPGFSVGMLKEQTNTSKSVFLKGYDSTPEVEQILKITDGLLEGKFPE